MAIKTATCAQRLCRSEDGCVAKEINVDGTVDKEELTTR